MKTLHPRKSSPVSRFLSVLFSPRFTQFVNTRRMIDFTLPHCEAWRKARSQLRQAKRDYCRYRDSMNTLMRQGRCDTDASAPRLAELKEAYLAAKTRFATLNDSPRLDGAAGGVR